MRHLIAAATLLPLAACNSGGTSVTATNASSAEVAAKVAAAGGMGAMMKPGRWEGTVTIADMKMPGLPADQQAQIATKTGKPEPIVSCVTAEDLKNGHGFFNAEQADDKSCRYDHFKMADGTLDGSMACARDGSKMAMTMQGTYTPEAMKMTVTMDMQGDGPYSTMKTTSMMDSHWAGVCRGDENKRQSGS